MGLGREGLRRRWTPGLGARRGPVRRLAGGPQRL